MEILLVEQDRLLKDLLRRALTSEISDVLEADSIPDAKTAMVHRAAGLIIVDAHLTDAIPFILNLQIRNGDASCVDVRLPSR